MKNKTESGFCLQDYMYICINYKTAKINSGSLGIGFNNYAKPIQWNTEAVS